MIKIIFNSIIIVCITIAASSCCGNRLSTCPDSRPVSFPRSEKCAMTAYQNAVKDFNLNLQGTLNVLDRVKLGFEEVSIKNESKLLHDKLDQESIRLRATLKASYLVVTRDPCSASERHSKLVESVNAKNYLHQELKAKLENEVRKNEIENTLNNYLYQRGKKEGRAMGRLNSLLKNFYNNNSKYPSSLNDINANELVSILGESRLEYKLLNSNEFSLRFAGEDYVLGSSDDKIYKGSSGSITFLE